MILGISLLVIGFLLAIFIYVYVALEGARRTIDAAPWPQDEAPTPRVFDWESEFVWQEICDREMARG